MVFVILPRFDSSKASMMINSICFIPSLLLLCSKSFSDFKNHTLTSFLDIISMLFQIASMIGWAIFWCKEKSIVLSLLVFLSLILVSCCWWENYVDKKCEKPLLKLLAESKKNLDKNSRHKNYLIISILNMIFTFVIMLFIFYIENPSNSIVKQLFTNFTDAFTSHKINISRDKGILEVHLIESDELLYYSNARIPIILLLIQIICSLLAYSTGKFICRVCMQLFSFSFPLALAAPITISIVTTFCRLRYKDVCIVSRMFGPFNYIYWYSELDFAQLDITLADYLLYQFYLNCGSQFIFGNRKHLVWLRQVNCLSDFITVQYSLTSH